MLSSVLLYLELKVDNIPHSLPHSLTLWWARAEQRVKIWALALRLKPPCHFFIYLFFIFYLLVSYSCPAFFPVALHYPIPRHCLRPWVLYLCSFICPFEALLSPHYSPSSFLPFCLWSLSVCSLFPCLWFYFACLFCWLGSTSRWDHMVFVFHLLAYFT